MVLQIMVYIFFTVGGLVFIKLGSDNFSLILKTSKISFTCSPYLMLGLSFYLVSFVMWTIIVKGNKLSVIYPLTTGLVQILIFIFAVIIFHEKVEPLKLIGTAIIILGVVLLNIK